MNENNEEFLTISNQDDLDYLIKRIENGPLFASSFKFEDDTLFSQLLEHLKIKDEEFRKKYFYFNKDRNLHISMSEFNYTWISTYGLIAKGKETDNNYVNACLNQFTVVSLLFDKAIETSKNENVYDVDSSYFGLLSSLSPALFHNILFYLEVFFKAYLSLNSAAIPHTHQLLEIYLLVTKTMFEKKHNNTFFHAVILDEFKKVIDYISTLPGSFKEHFVKYDDNSEDNTIIIFNSEHLQGIKRAIDLSGDFIYSYYREGESVSNLKTGLYERLIGKAETEIEKQRIKETYSHLIVENVL